MEPEESAPPLERYLVVSVAGELLGLPLAGLRELDQAVGVTPLPLVPAWVRGLAQRRGEVLAVLDLLPFLGREALPDRLSNRMVVLGPPAGEPLGALLVERVLGVAGVPPEAVRRAAGERGPDALPLAPYLTGGFDHESGPVAVLDAGRLLADMAVSRPA